MDEHNRVFGRLDVVPKPGSKVPSIMKAHKQGVEMGGSPAWDAMKDLFDDLPVGDLKHGTWLSEEDKQKSKSTSDGMTLHDQRKQQTHARFEHDAKRDVIEDFEKEIPTSGFKTDNLATSVVGSTELVEQKSDDEKVSPRSVWLKVGELAELSHNGRDIDTVTFRCRDITRDNESAVRRAVVALAHLHDVTVEIVTANDDAEWDTKDNEILSYDPSEAEIDESVEGHIGVLPDVLGAIRDEANNINVT